MKLYSTVEDYIIEYGGQMTNRKQIENYLLLATADIDRVTFGRIKTRGFENLTDEQQDLIKRACCLQSDYLLENSESDCCDIASYSAGSISVSFKTNSSSEASRENFSEDAYKLVRATGLTHRCL